jgi:ribosomal subunit interface protein
MKITIQTKNITLTQAIEDFIEEKINSLEKFIKVIYDGPHYSSSSGKEKAAVLALVEIGKETMHHRKGPFFRAECEINFPGKKIRAEAFSKDLRAAIVEVKDELQRELKEEKEKIISKRRK